ncbi:MAG: GNAT family N-acetyltransferase [Candidatus Micrarchaeota archaeon]
MNLAAVAVARREEIAHRPQAELFLRPAERLERARISRQMDARGIRVVDISEFRPEHAPIFDSFYKDVYLKSFPKSELQPRSSFTETMLANAPPEKIDEYYRDERNRISRAVARVRQRYGSVRELGVEEARRRYGPLQEELSALVKWKGYMDRFGRHVRPKLLVAVDKRGKVAGGVLSTFDMKNRVGLIEYVLTAPEMRNRGVGSFIYHNLEEHFAREHGPDFLLYGEMNPPRAPLNERDRRLQEGAFGSDLQRAVFWGKQGMLPVGPVKGGTAGTSRGSFFQPGSPMWGTERLPLNLSVSIVGKRRYAKELTPDELKRVFVSQYAYEYPIVHEDPRAFDWLMRQRKTFIGPTGGVSRNPVFAFGKAAFANKGERMAGISERRDQLARKMAALKDHPLFARSVSQLSADDMKLLAAKAPAKGLSPEKYLQGVRETVLREHRRTVEEHAFFGKLLDRLKAAR